MCWYNDAPMRAPVVCLLLASCGVDATEEAAPVVDNVLRPPPPGEKDQGEFLNGSVSDPLAIDGYHLNASRFPKLVSGPTKVTRVEAESGHLVAYDGQTVVFSGADARFQGMELSLDGSSSLLRIVDVSTKTPASPYTLEIVTNGVATPYCKDNGTAFASRGRWTTKGAHESTDTLNFTCFDGVIWKCFTWGYDPGNAPVAAADPRDDPWRVHQACTRMARADRCGDGAPKTFEETAILIRDRVAGGQPHVSDPSVPPLRFPTADPPPPNVYWFEAAWTEDGAICLSRERWKSMPLDEDSCLPDPRKVVTAQTCDEIGIDTLTTTATFFNSSKIGQLYLNRWHKGADQLVTVRGMAGEGAAAEPPYPGYVFDEQIGLLMRNPPDSFDLPNEPDTADPDLASFGLFRYTTDRAASTSAPTAQHTLVGYEGYVYVDNPEGAYLELRLYQSGTDFVSSVSPPAPGWSDLGHLGYIDPP